MARENRPFSRAVRAGCAHYFCAVLPRFICYARDVGINSLPTNFSRNLLTALSLPLLLSFSLSFPLTLSRDIACSLSLISSVIYISASPPYSLTTFSQNLHLSLVFSISPLYLRRSVFRTLLSDLSSAISPSSLSFLSLNSSSSPTTSNSRNFSRTHSLFLSLSLFPPVKIPLSHSNFPCLSRNLAISLIP